MSVNTVTLALATLATALTSGLLYGYSCSVNPGLGHLPDAAYIAAMQSINRSIQNPVFFASFMGALLLLPLAAVLERGGPGFYPLLAAAILYAVGVMGVTVLGNVPLNNALDAFQLQDAPAAAVRAARQAFEPKWNGLHTVRTVAAVTSLALAVWACIRYRINGG